MRNFSQICHSTFITTRETFGYPSLEEGAADFLVILARAMECRVNDLLTAYLSADPELVGCGLTPSELDAVLRLRDFIKLNSDEDAVGFVPPVTFVFVNMNTGLSAVWTHTL